MSHGPPTHRQGTHGHALNPIASSHVGVQPSFRNALLPTVVIRRELTDYLKSAFQQHPVVSVTGPRQSGKDVLRQQLTSRKASSFSAFYTLGIKATYFRLMFPFWLRLPVSQVSSLVGAWPSPDGVRSRSDGAPEVPLGADGGG